MDSGQQIANGKLESKTKLEKKNYNKLTHTNTHSLLNWPIFQSYSRLGSKMLWIMAAIIITRMVQLPATAAIEYVAAWNKNDNENEN